ncbi:hypothetical protein L1887_57955 [Cichorium endivia]|nr:hypothetical protein L1887_57955 [Cichorium endivia]
MPRRLPVRAARRAAPIRRRGGRSATTMPRSATLVHVRRKSFFGSHIFALDGAGAAVCDRFLELRLDGRDGGSGSSATLIGEYRRGVGLSARLDVTRDARFAGSARCDPSIFHHLA